MFSDSDSSDDYEHIENRLISTAKFQLNQMPSLQDEEIERLKKELFQKLEEIKAKRSEYLSKISELKSQKLQISVEIKNERRNFKKSLLQEKRNFSKMQEELEVSFHEEMSNVTKQYSSMEINYTPRSVHDKSQESQNQTQISLGNNGDTILSNNENSQNAQAQTELTTLTNKVQSLVSVYEDKKEMNQQSIASLSESFNQVDAENNKMSAKIKNLEAQLVHKREELEQLKQNNQKNLEIIKSKITKCDKNMKRTYDTYNDYITNSESVYSSEIDDINNINDGERIAVLNRLKRRILERKQQIKELKEKINSSQVQHSHDIDSTKEIAQKLKDQIKNIDTVRENDLSNTIKQAVQHKNELEDRIAQLDPILRKARDKHLKLQSTVNALDFEINGRFGEYQRSAQLATKKMNSQLYDSPRKSKKNHFSNSINMNF